MSLIWYTGKELVSLFNGSTYLRVSKLVVEFVSLEHSPSYSSLLSPNTLMFRLVPFRSLIHGVTVNFIPDIKSIWMPIKTYNTYETYEI